MGKTKIKVEPASFTAEIDGGRVTVGVGRDGLEALGRRGATVGGLNELITKENQEMRAREARKAALAAAAKNPLPALLAWQVNSEPMNFELIGVRGVDRRTGYALITRAGGSKDSVPPGNVLRRLSEEELATLNALSARVLELRQALPEPVSIFTVERELDDLTVPGRFDPQADQWVAEWDGQELRANSPFELTQAVERARVAALYPVQFNDRGAISAYTGVGRPDYLAKTTQEAVAHLEAKAALSAASAELSQFRRERRFDFSVFTEEA